MLSTWPRRAAFVIFCIVVGLLVGWAITPLADRADAVPPKGENYFATVTTKKQGVNKYEAGKVGKMRADVTYTKASKKEILNALEKAWTQQNAKGVFPRKKMWRKFRNQDSCFYTWKPRDSDGPDYWTCRRAKAKDVDITGMEVRGYICSGLAGIALDTASGGPVAWVAIGAGWGACMWQDRLEQAAGN